MEEFCRAPPTARGEFFRWLFKPKVVILPMPWRVVVKQLPDKHRATRRSGVGCDAGEPVPFYPVAVS